MPAKTVEQVKDLKNYKQVLKSDMTQVQKKAQPFHLYDKFKFDGKTGPLLVVGTWDGKVLDALKANSSGEKAVGRVVQGAEFIEFEINKGAAKSGEMETAMTFSGFSGGKTLAVPKLGETKREEAQAKVSDAQGKVNEEALKEIEQRRNGLRERMKPLSKRLTPEEMKALERASNEIKTATKAEVLDAYNAIAEAERVLAAAEQRLGKTVGPDGTTGPAGAVKEAYARYATEQEKRNKQIDDAIKTAPPTAKTLDDSATLGDSTVKDVRKKLAQQLGGRAEGQKWQAEEIKKIKEATEKLERQGQLGGQITQLQAAKKNAEKEITNLEKAIKKLKEDPPSGLDEEVIAKRLKATEEELPGARKDLAEAEQKLKSAEDEKAKVDKWVTDNDAEKIAGKHGSGRHGAQTGLEGQARRVATEGYGADQPGNEAGTSRPLVDPKGQPLQKIQWNKVTIEWQEENGKRTIKNKEKAVNEIVLQAETHFQETIASSLFLGPEFEKEAVTRALAIAKDQCKWTEIHDGKAWVPLKRIAITLGKPAKAVGWGTGVKKRDGAQKKTLLEANRILEEFRNGKINQAKMMEQLNAQLATKPDGGGVALVPTCMVIVDRTAPDKPWINVTQYPNDGGTPGWSIATEKVRKDKDSPEEVGPACSGV